MTIPHWVAEVEAGLNITPPAITVYRTSIRWAHATLREGQTDILMQGMKGCWPSSQNSAQICKLAVTLHREILPEKSMVGAATKTLLRRWCYMIDINCEPSSTRKKARRVTREKNMMKLQNFPRVFSVYSLVSWNIFRLRAKMESLCTINSMLNHYWNV